jgi:transcriptional regulator with XRE-family HTH domain
MKYLFTHAESEERAMSQLRYWREQRGLSQRQLGQTVGVTDNAISQFERGIIKPRVRLCDALAQALGIEFDVLFQDFYGFSIRETPTRRVAHRTTP